MASVTLFAPVLDEGLDALDSDANKILICNATPTTYTEANSFKLGEKSFGVGGCFGAPSTSADGRQVASFAITDGDCTASGTPVCWAVIDDANTRLLAVGGLTGAGAVDSAKTFSLASFTINMPGIAVAPAFPMAGAVIDLWLETAQYYDSGAGGAGQAVTTYLSCSRASIGYAKTSTNTLTQFAADTLRITDLGLLVEEARTNVVLQNRDLTNAAWTKTNITAAKDQTGPDGVSNSASSITATAGNATVLQSITLASSARYQSAWIKRITGSGTVNMTMDNGSTWTAVTVTSGWTRVEVPTQTLANPTVGFRIVTNGDAVAVDFVQNEDGTWASSVIPTTGAAATRAADAVNATGSLATNLTGTTVSTLMDVKTQGQIMEGNRRLIAEALSGPAFMYTSGTAGTAIASYLNGADLNPVNFGSGDFQIGAKCAFAKDGSGRSVVANAGTVATDANTQSLTTAGIGYGSNGFNLNCYIRRLVAWNSRLADATLQGFTQPD